ncbi:MAG: 50S ribosomal protein L10 [Bacillota bacterium]|nr:50S ribosomal protein L10 [Bacillota bacterium]
MNYLLSKKAKEKMLEEITEELKQSELVIVTDYRGLNVKTINELRGKLRQEQCRYRVTKNTMNRLACRTAGVEELEGFFEGPTAIAYSSEDPVAVAKVFNDYTKQNDALLIKGGMLSGKLLDPNEIKALGEIPPREILLAKVVGGFQAPISGLVGVLHGTLRQLVYTVDAVRQQKESA